MSGICGLVFLNGEKAGSATLAPVMRRLRRRGPGGTSQWHSGRFALGLASLFSTPEAHTDPGLLRMGLGDCSIVADARLDNRAQLIEALRIEAKGRPVGDAELILSAYLRWGEHCVDRLAGDFAFAIADKRRDRLFCARDRLGNKPFNWTLIEERCFAFASDAGALRALEGAGERVNEARVADFLAGEEGADLVSTFFDGISRLPPAHSLTVDQRGVRARRYWSLEACDPLRLEGDDAYAEAFLERFERSVERRLRAPEGSLAAMLSGGMDSGSVVAVANKLSDAAGTGAITTFSAISGETTGHVEDEAILASAKRSGSTPRFVRLDQNEAWAASASLLWHDAGEPFDHSMTMLAAIYDAASREGFRTMLDGVSGDVAVGSASAPAALLRRGSVLTAWRELAGANAFFGTRRPVWRQYARLAGSAFAPGWLRSLRAGWQARAWQDDATRGTLLDEDIARRIDFAQRRADFHRTRIRQDDSWSQRRVWELTHPNVVVARERYERVAALYGMETRDPFADTDLIEFCAALPPDQLTRDGWPKIILRNAMAGSMDDAVRWRRGKEHHGWAFTSSILAKRRAEMRELILSCGALREYVSSEALKAVAQRSIDQEIGSDELALTRLSLWLASERVAP